MKLVRHTLFNLAGLGLPLAVAVVSIPELLNLLGVAKFGLLTLIWAVVSYFGLFDLGLGRALTYRMAQRLAADPEVDVSDIAGTALISMAIIGLIAAAAMAVLATPAVGWIRGIPDREEAINALLAMSLAVPAVVLTSGLRGILEARQAFGWVNVIRIPLGLFTFLAPLVVAVLVGPRLDVIAAALLAGRWLALVAHYGAARQVTPGKRIVLSWDRSELRPLLTTGGWLTVGNLVGPLMGYADRFIIAAAVSVAAVAYYATPNELVTKLWIVPGALTSVLFPAFSAAAARADGQAQRIASQSLAWLFVVLLPVALALAVFAHEVLALWLGQEFAAEGAMVLRLMACGIMVNCMAHVPLTQLQGAGSARGPALLQLLQILPYIALLWWASATYGVNGTAGVWAARMFVDTTAMFYLASKIDAAQQTTGAAAHGLSIASAMGLLAFASSFVGLPVEVRGLIWFSASIAVAAMLRPWRSAALGALKAAR